MMDGSTGMTRCDALIYAATRMLEQFRPMLDGTANIKSVQLDLRISPDNKVHTMNLAPSFETHPNGKPSIEKFTW